MKIKTFTDPTSSLSPARRRKIAEAVEQALAAHESREGAPSDFTAAAQPPVIEAAPVTPRPPKLAALITRLVRAVDPNDELKNMKSMEIPLSITGRFVATNQPGMFSSPNARAVVSFEKEEVVFHDVPEGRTTVFSGDVVAVIDERNPA